MIMHDTVFTLSSGASEQPDRRFGAGHDQKVQDYVPGYRLSKASVQQFGSNNPVTIPGVGSAGGSKPACSGSRRRGALHLPA
jgi:acetaldehyde dehydrogenase